VWLIFVLVGLHTAFPLAFAAVGRALWLPLLLALVGIVFRGAGFVLHSYAVGAIGQQVVWGHGKRASSAVKTEELHQVGKRPAGPLAFDFQRAFARIAP
jgi:cytochrome d ubiquinol oxidase subunit II